MDLAYTYDTRGNLISLSNNLDPTRNQSFGYDKLNRLITFNGPWGTGSYTYDLMGNRLSTYFHKYTNVFYA
jgi:YD repeat-containing protein